MVSLLVIAVTTTGCVSPWLQFDGGPTHQGNNTNEMTLTAANVSGLQQAWQVTLSDPADGAPVVATVSTPSGSMDLVFVGTSHGNLEARNLHTGALVWSDSFPNPGCLTFFFAFQCFTTSSPVLVGNFVYVYSPDAKVHKVATATGVEDTTGGWPVTTTLKPTLDKGSSSLSSATAADGHTYLYSTFSSWGGAGDYQGHVVAIDLASAETHVFNTVCSDQTTLFTRDPAGPDCPQVSAGVWARSGTTYDKATDRILLATGNGPYDPAAHDWADSVLALHPDGTGVDGGPVDSFTPTNFQDLQDQDLDLGSTLPAILPTLAGSTFTDLGVQGGKEQKLFLLNLADLSGQGGPGHTGGELQEIDVPQGGQVLTAPAVWTNPADGRVWIFVGTSNGISGLTVDVGTDGVPVLTPQWTNASLFANSPVVANGVVYAAGAPRFIPGILGAFDPTTGTNLWKAATSFLHWQSPVVVGGYVLLEDQTGNLTAWHL